MERKTPVLVEDRRRFRGSTRRGQHNRKTVNLKETDTPKAKQLFVAVATNNKGYMREKRPPWLNAGGCFAAAFAVSSRKKSGNPNDCRNKKDEK